MILPYYRFDGDQRYNDSSSQPYGQVLGPPRDFADSDGDSRLLSGNATLFHITFLVIICHRCQ